jgi:hypothetical protein
MQFRGSNVVEKVKRWFEWLPGWLPVCSCILVGVFVLGQYQQSISDRLKSLEEQVKAIQDYMRTNHSEHPKNTGDSLNRRYYDDSPPQDARTPNLQ